VRPPNPQGDARLEGARSDDEALVLVVRAVIRRLLLRQRGPQRDEGVVGACPAIGERRVQQVELLAQGPHADAKDEAAARHHVERSVALGDLEGMVVAEHQDVGGQPHPLGHGRQVPERRQRVPVRGPSDFRNIGGDADVLAAREVVVAEPIGRTGDLHEFGHARALLPTGMGARHAGHHRRDDRQPHQDAGLRSATTSRLEKYQRPRS
jgi:hypothetical protein